MKKHLRTLAVSRSHGYGHYNFHITYPSGNMKTISNVANAPLFDQINSLDCKTISVNHSVWKQIRYYL